jgi:WS/DGAT/MGAT family acyltransferase
MNDNQPIPSKESERLSRHDSAFIFLDNGVTAHDGCGLSIFDGPVPFENMRDRMFKVIPEVPKFLQRPVHVPFGLGHPTWEYDPDFDVNYHLEQLHLEAPGSEEQLWKLTERLANERLNPNRPMWRIYLIQGLSGGRTASFAKIHHALTDGMGAMKVMMANIETERIVPEPIAPGTPLPAMPDVPPDPSAWARITRALRDNARATATGIVGMPKRFRRYGRRAKSPHFWQALGLVWRYLQSPTIRFPFNRGLSGRVHFGTFRLPLAEMRAIRANSGGTVNDVLLATVAGGFDKYAVRNGHDTTGKFIRLQVPTNIRTEETDVPLGNHVGSAPLLVPFGVDHPVERLHGITESMREAKSCNVGYGMRVFLDGFEAALTPPGMRLLFGFAAWRPYQWLAAKIPKKPNLHLYVSNMPGPEFATYTLGAKLMIRHPMGPVIPASGLACAAMSCENHMQVTFTADVESVPDVRQLAEESVESFEELRRAAGVEAMDIETPDPFHEGLAK